MENLNNFFEKQVAILKNNCHSGFMYCSEHSTKSNDGIVTLVWDRGMVYRCYVDIKNNKLFRLERWEETEEKFLSRLVG